MTKFYYGKDGKGKLTRDNLVHKHLTEGHKIKAYNLPMKERGMAILNKMAEERNELVEAHKQNSHKDKIEEVADLQTLINSYMKIEGISKGEIADEMKRKVDLRGAFDEGLIVEWVDFAPDGVDYQKWVDYCRANSDRYIEEKTND